MFAIDAVFIYRPLGSHILNEDASAEGAVGIKERDFNLTQYGTFAFSENKSPRIPTIDFCVCWPIFHITGGLPGIKHI